MKIVANLPDINQLFNDGLKDIFPYSNIRVCVIHRVSGDILHIFRDIGKPIRFKDFAFNIKEHDLGLYVPSFYAKRNWKSEDVCEDSILTIGANTISFNGYDAMPIFIRPDGTVRKYVVVGLTRGVMDNGVLRSIPGRYPSSGYTIEEFRSAVRKGRDPKKWGLMNQDMLDCLQLLFKFAFQVTKTKEALGNGLGREKSLTGGTLVLGGQSGYTDPFQFGKDKPDARLKSLICVVDGRLQFSNWDGKFSPIKIANNKTLDECIVEETEDYIIYSDGEVTPENPIPEGIYFACRVDKHTGEIYYGEGYENIPSGGNYYGFDHIFIDDNNYSFIVSEGNNRSLAYRKNPGKENLFISFIIEFLDSTEAEITRGYPNPYNFSTRKEQNVQHVEFNTYKAINPHFYSNIQISLVKVNIKNMLTVNSSKNGFKYVRTKCPTGKITQITDSSILNSSLLIDNQEVNYTSLFSQTVTRDESDPTTILTPSNPELKITPIRPDLNQPYLDTFTENGIYPFNLMGRYILHKDTGEILERLSPFDSTLNFYGAPSIFDPSIHDIHTLFFPFYAKRSWKGEFLSDTMVFEIPKTTHRNGFEVMPIFRDANGNLRPFVSCGAFKGSVVDNQLRSLPEKLPVVSLTIDQARTYARTNRDSKFNIETLDFITMVQFLYKIAFQDLNSQKILGNGWTNKSDKVKTGATMWIGNKSGSHDNPFFSGDVPDNRLRASLVYVNGRLEYYTDPNEPIEIEIANNKTLDECIVEETEDYIIYSDGEVTVDNPIPEGIYFACRVDKHTGEIYCGEGYENYWTNFGKYPGTNGLVEIIDYKTSKVTREPAGSSQNSTIAFRVLNDLASGEYSFSSEILSIQQGIGKFTLGKTSDDRRVIIEKIGPVSNTFSIAESDLNKYFGFHQQVTNSNIGDFIMFTKTVLVKGDVPKPYVKSKCPTGKVYWKNSGNISHLGYSFILKNFKTRTRRNVDSTGNMTDVPVLYFMDSMGGEIRNSTGTTNGVYSDTLMVSNTCKELLENKSVKIGVYTDITRKLSITNVSSNPSFNRYKSMTGFYIYKGDFTEAEFNTEIAKNIKPVSVSRAKSNSNGNQVSLFGIEDFYGNVFSLVDGVVIKDNGIHYSVNPNDYGNTNNYNKHVVFTPPMGSNTDEPLNGYTKNMQLINNFINYPREIGGDGSTYYTDFHWSHKKGQTNIFLFGARWDRSVHSGCFSWYCQYNITNMSPATSCRLTYLPEGIPNTNTEEV